MRTQVVLIVLLVWYALSVVGFLLFSGRAVADWLCTRKTWPMLLKGLGTYVAWVAWTIGYSLVMLGCLLLAALANRAEVLAVGLVAYMALGHGAGLWLKVPTRGWRLLMLGAPPLQAAITLATRAKG